MTQQNTGDPEIPPSTNTGGGAEAPAAAAVKIEEDVQAFGDPEIPPKDTGDSGTTPST